MSGPASAHTPCPWCKGSGVDREIPRRAWSGEASTGRYETILIVVACDGCAGVGQVTRQAAQAMQAWEWP